MNLQQPAAGNPPQGMGLGVAVCVRMCINHHMFANACMGVCVVLADCYLVAVVLRVIGG